MECPLVLFPAGVLGTTQYYAPCACLGICELARCKYRQNGFIIKIQAVGTTTTNAVAILGKKMRWIHAAGSRQQQCCCDQRRP
jgi:hypothetical protein